MKKDITEIIFILDRSGSMSGLEEDTIGSFNSLIKKQKKQEGEAAITTVLFDNKIEKLHDSVLLSDMKKLTEEDYFTRGSTSLLDAIGFTVRDKKIVYAETLKEERPEKVMFVIITDGMENSSLNFSYDEVRQMISETKEKYNWEFLFIGANIDAVKEGSKIGIEQDRAVRYHADKKGSKLIYDQLNETIHEYRSHKEIKREWKKSIEKDFRNRSK
jgi:uncharacterized protein YegL